MKSMHSLILILSLTLSLVVCPTPNTEISYDEEPNFTALPNEFPELSSFYLRFDETTQKNLLELKNVIGYLPFNEQIALMKSIQGTSEPNLFDYSKYERYIKTGSIFDAQAKAIGDYIAQQEKTLSYGIGCLKAVSNKYASKSEYNQQMQSVIYNSIDNILNAQSLNNQCQAEFLTALQTISIKKRAYLFSIQKASNKIQQNPDIFEYKDDAPSILIDAYKKFAFCQNVYTNILATSSMKAEIALANMDDCKDYDNPNNNAGNSSDVYDNPSIEYRKNDKQKGINNGNLVRSDQKTFNGYLLNHGFNLGKATYNNNYYTISSEYNTLIENVLNDFSDNKYVQTVIGIIGNIKDQLFDYKPFSGLVENYIDILFDTTDISDFINDYKNGCTSKKSYSISCPNSSTCKFPTETTLKTFKNKNLQFTSFELYGQCSTTPGKMTVVAKAEHPLLGNVFDIQYNGERVGAKTISTIQACMASFSSGGSNDKDACRDVITKKCGMNIDYQCKKSGFYDYINANPNSVPLPPQCSLPTSSNDDCFEWIETYFFAGHFVVKPSAFVGYNLYLSTASNGKADNLKSLDYIAPNYRNENGNTPDGDVGSRLNELISDIPIEILGTTADSQADISEKTVLMDKGAYKILHDGAKSLSFGFIVILLNIVLLL